MGGGVQNMASLGKIGKTSEMQNLQFANFAFRAFYIYCEGGGCFQNEQSCTGEGETSQFLVGRL